MLPTIRSFMDAHRLPDVTVVADAGMVSAANQHVIEEAGLSFILGARIPEVSYVVVAWRRDHRGEDIPDGYVFTQQWLAGPGDRSSRPNTRSRARPRSSGTGSSSSPAAPAA